VREAIEEEINASGTVTLPFAASSIAVARRRLTSELLAAGAAEPVVADAALVASELLTNAVRHARPLPGGKLRVGWVLADGVIELTVTDGGATTRPREAWPSASSLGGRGLAIVARLCGRWGVRTGETTTTVWAILGIRAAEAARPAVGARSG
jgi:anti-sigma regulatory factor (Ser/Thr protein kinase)